MFRDTGGGRGGGASLGDDWLLGSVGTEVFRDIGGGGGASLEDDWFLGSVGTEVFRDSGTGAPWRDERLFGMGGIEAVEGRRGGGGPRESEWLLGGGRTDIFGEGRGGGALLED